jgi:Flp pilus assembly protein TadB
MNWKTVVRAFGTIARSEAPGGHDPMDGIEVPGSWFSAASLRSGWVVILGHCLFHITWWMGVIAVLATFLLVLVAAAPPARPTSRRSAR